jgi:hypothetical protein
MASASEAVNQVSRFVAGKLSLEAFEDWSVDYMREAYRAEDSEPRYIAGLVRSILNAFEDDEDLEPLKSELRNAIRPFGSSRPSGVFVVPPKRKPQEISLAFGSSPAPRLVHPVAIHSVLSEQLAFGARS